MVFRTSEILSFKKTFEQTHGGLARRQNNGDNKPFSENRCIIIIFPRMNSLFTEDIWERTFYDRDGKILMVRSIERFFLFSPASIRYANKHLLKTVDHTPHTSLWPSVAYIVIVSPPADAPTLDEFSHHFRDTRDTPILFRCKTVHK